MAKLLCKNSIWEWSTECQQSFEALHNAFISDPVMKQYDSEQSVIIETDASDCAVGAVAFQFFSHPSTGVREKHPVAYWSRLMCDTERRYSVGEKELLAIVDVFKEWHTWLLGCPGPIQVITDHKNLEYFMVKRQLGRRQGRWLDKLAEFDFKIIYRPGRENDAADALSHRPDYHMGKGVSLDAATNPSSFAQLLPEMEDWKSSTQVSERHIKGTTVSIDMGMIKPSLRDRIVEGTRVDEGVQDLRARGLQLVVYGSKLPPWSDVVGWTQDGLLTFEGRVVVPDFADARLDILRMRHDSKLVGHPGQDRTHSLIKRDFYWEGLSKWVKAYVQSCQECARHKPRRHAPYGLLQPLPIPSHPWSEISMDLVGPLPKSDGYDAILVVVDCFSKMAHFILATMNLTSDGLVKLFVNHIFSKHGIPEKVVSDRGSIFISEWWREFTKLAGMSMVYSSPYHPQTDGQTERVNQHLEQYLSLYTSYNMDDWSQLLPWAEFAYNNSPSHTTKLSPFEVLYGCNIRFDFAGIEGRLEAAKESRVDTQIFERYRRIAECIRWANEQSAGQYNKHHQAPPPLAISDEVFLSTRNLSTERPSPKLEARFIGPYRILSFIGKNAVKLDLPETVHTSPIVHISRIEPAVPNSIPNRRQDPPPPVLVNGEEEFVVERIVDSRRRRTRLEYKVEWKGYTGDDQFQWLPWEEVKDLAALDEFYRLYPDKPGGPEECKRTGKGRKPLRRVRGA